MDIELDRAVRERARKPCEYCLVPGNLYQTPFQIDHIIALKHGGATESSNLALSCYHCNSHKGPNHAGVDPSTSSITPLYNPRTDVWIEHFAMEADGRITGVTPRGWATVQVLNMNDPNYVSVRQSLLIEGILTVEGHR